MKMLLKNEDETNLLYNNTFDGVVYSMKIYNIHSKDEVKEEDEKSDEATAEIDEGGFTEEKCEEATAEVVAGGFKVTMDFKEGFLPEYQFRGVGPQLCGLDMEREYDCIFLVANWCLIIGHMADPEELGPVAKLFDKYFGEIITEVLRDPGFETCCYCFLKMVMESVDMDPSSLITEGSENGDLNDHEINEK